MATRAPPLSRSPRLAFARCFEMASLWSQMGRLIGEKVPEVSHARHHREFHFAANAIVFSRKINHSLYVGHAPQKIFPPLFISFV